MSASDLPLPQYTRSLSDGDVPQEIGRLRDLFENAHSKNIRQRCNSLDCSGSLPRVTSDTTASTDFSTSTLMNSFASLSRESYSSYPPPVSPQPLTLTPIPEDLSPRERHKLFVAEQDMLYYRAILGIFLALNCYKIVGCLQNEYDSACKHLLENDPSVMLTTANLDILTNIRIVWRNLQDHQYKATAINIARLLSQYKTHSLLVDLCSDFLDRKYGHEMQLLSLLAIGMVLVCQSKIFTKLHNSDLQAELHLTWNWQLFYSKRRLKSYIDSDSDSDSSSEPDVSTATPPHTPPRPYTPGFI